MLVFNTSIKKNKFVKTQSTNFTKIAVSGLAITSLLALCIFSHFMLIHIGPITADAIPLQATSEDINSTSSFSSADIQNNQVRSLHMEAFATESQPDSQYVPDSMVFGTPLVYTITGKPDNERELLEFTFSAMDADGDQLVYSVSNLPSGASFDPNNQTFSWAPRYDQAGVYSVHLEVYDGQLTDSEDVTITVVQLYEDWDVNGDGAADVLDMVLVGQHWNEVGLTGWIREDANEDGTVNVLDMIIIGQNSTG